MIFPIFDSFKSLYKSPFIMVLVLLNLAFYFAGFAYWESLYREQLTDKFLLKTQGSIYATEILNDKSYDHSIQKKIAIKSLTDNSLKVVLGQLAFRDHKFLTKSDYIYNDVVGLNWWTSKKEDFIKTNNSFSSTVYGFSKAASDLKHLITYQFFHSGIVHLLGNLLLLFLVGSALEARTNGALLFTSYVLSGIAGALLYDVFSAGASIPLVGASGSVSGLIGLYVILFWKKPTRYFYYLFWPHPRWYGVLNLPAWSLAFFWMIGDFSGVMAGVPGFTGIAYWAHIGGALCGATIGVVVLGFKAANQELADARLLDQQVLNQKLAA